MAEDGMILNFGLSDSLPAVRRKTKFEGGSWKDRARAKKKAQYRFQQREGGNQSAHGSTQGPTNQPPLGKVSDDFPDLRPSKKSKLDRDHSENGPPPPSSDRPQKPEQKQANGRREVVSSLFTSNPTPSQTRAQSNAEDDRPVKPSNAPLVDGLDTFTDLGLTPAIATHLLTKMSLKTPTAIQKATISQMMSDDGDVFIQSETGSGKTLAYLLPIVQRIMKIAEQQTNGASGGEETPLHRDSGLFAIVLAPTRELCKQIAVVLERLLGCAHYIVAGTVLGGEKKKSEKARLRKGLNILVATPGRLADHIDNTSALDISSVRWLVLDEGDRLMDLGFEQDITKIITTLDKKQKRNSGQGLPHGRTTILCSATLKMNVQKLGEISLKDASLIKGEESDSQTVDHIADSPFLAPAQLKQSYMVVPAKLRLVTLTALLRWTFARKGSVNKAIVFVSCADSVEFHYRAFTRSTNSSGTGTKGAASNASSLDTSPEPSSLPDHDSIAPAPFLSPSNTPTRLQIYKLHGSLPQPTRTSIVDSFRASTTPSLLVATDVASRGLDLPNLDLVIEYDPAFSSDDHLHRIGRTARLGRDGRAIIFLLPGKEEGYVDVLRSSYKPFAAGVAAGNVSHADTNEVLRKGFTPTSGIVRTSQKEWEARATEFQLDVERWVLAELGNREVAKRAFQSHVRAYATHVGAERRWFDMKELHLGHLAKAFGLRDAPGRMNLQGMRSAGKKGGKRRTGSAGEERRVLRGAKEDGGDGERLEKGEDDAARKMRDMVRKQKMMMGAGADEFNIA